MDGAFRDFWGLLFTNMASDQWQGLKTNDKFSDPSFYWSSFVCWFILDNVLVLLIIDTGSNPIVWYPLYLQFLKITLATLVTTWSWALFHVHVQHLDHCCEAKLVNFGTFSLQTWLPLLGKYLTEGNSISSYLPMRGKKMRQLTNPRLGKAQVQKPYLLG